jgi:hypothetical protein
MGFVLFFFFFLINLLIYIFIYLFSCMTGSHFLVLLYTPIALCVTSSTVLEALLVGVYVNWQVSGSGNYGLLDLLSFAWLGRCRYSSPNPTSLCLVPMCKYISSGHFSKNSYFSLFIHLEGNQVIGWENRILFVSLSLSLSLYIYIYMFNILFHNLAVFTIFRKFDNFLYEPDVKLMG